MTCPFKVPIKPERVTTIDTVSPAASLAFSASESELRICDGSIGERWIGGDKKAMCSRMTGAVIGREDAEAAGRRRMA